MTHWITTWWHSHFPHTDWHSIVTPIVSLPLFALASVVGNALGDDWKQILFFSAFAFVVERVISKRLDNHLKSVNEQVFRATATAESIDKQHRADKDRDERIEAKWKGLDDRVRELESWRNRNPMGGA